MDFRLGRLVLALALLGAAPPPLRITEVPSPSVTVLLFHQISATPVESTNGGEDQVKKPWLSPAAFDTLLTDAERRGYAYVTLEQALAFFRGEAVTMPPKPLLLTFDDGYVNADVEGTPLLRKHRATAVMFFEGHLTGTDPTRLTLAQLRAMQASGVWDVQSHGWAGHSNLVVDAAGTKSPYWYANLAWLADQHRLETPDEFERRVHDDLARFRADYAKPLNTTIHVFAYPSGEFGQNAPLPAGGDLRARLEAGHSDADGLTPRLFAAVRSAGYDAAFAVSIPGVVAPAGRESDLLALQRLGVGADFQIASLDALDTNGIDLPEIVDAHFTDPGPVAVLPDGFLLATSAAPVVHRLDANGRLMRTYRIPALLDDRAGHPALVSGIVARGADVILVQQAGQWGGTPRLTRLRAEGDELRVVERHPLTGTMNWLVGIAPFRGRILGMTDRGDLYDVEAGTPFGRVATTDPAADRNGRFAGPFALGDDVAVYDRVAHTLLTLDASFAPVSATPLGGALEHFAATGDGFVAVDAADRRHVLRRWTVAR